MNHPPLPIRASVLVLAVLATAACRSSGFTSFLKTSSGDQRSDLVEGVGTMRADLVKTHEQFDLTYDALRRVLRHEGENAGVIHQEFLNEVDSSAKRAEELKTRVTELGQQAGDFFAEWDVELEQFTSQNMRKRSELMLKGSRESFDDFVVQLARTHDQMQVILVAWRDYMLFFSHNLNARAIKTLEIENEDFAQDFEDLREALADSEARAEKFLKVLEGRASS